MNVSLPSALCAGSACAEFVDGVGARHAEGWSVSAPFVVECIESADCTPCGSLKESEHLEFVDGVGAGPA